MKKLAPLIVALLVSAAPALADGGAFRDGDEQPFCETGGCGDSDYMDFRRLTFGHGRNESVVRHGVRTIERWKTKVLGGRHGVTIHVHLNTDDDWRAERSLRIRRKHGELWAGMFRGKYLRKRVAGRVRVWRPDRRSVKVRFDVRMLGDDLERYRWNVSWAQRDIACPGSCSTDTAPDRGWFEHRL